MQARAAVGRDGPASLTQGWLQFRYVTWPKK